MLPPAAQVGAPVDDGASIPLRVWATELLEATIGINFEGIITEVRGGQSATRHCREDACSESS